MTYLELIRDADWKLDKGKITLEEFEDMIEPLRQTVCDIEQVRSEIGHLPIPLSERDTSDIQWAEMFTITKVLQIIDKYAEQEPCDDAVSRKSVINTIDNMDNALDENRTVEEYKALLKECYEVLPSVRPQEPKTGHWIGIDEEPHEDYECDKCGYVVSTFTANIKPQDEYKYCPNCGAKMVEPRESE